MDERDRRSREAAQFADGLQHAQETVGQDAAVQECPKLALDEARHDTIDPLGLNQKRFQIPGHDSVENRFFRASGRVGGWVCCRRIL